MKDNIKNIDFSQDNDDDERIHAIIENEKKVLKKRRQLIKKLQKKRGCIPWKSLRIPLSSEGD